MIELDCSRIGECVEDFPIGTRVRVASYRKAAATDVYLHDLEGVVCKIKMGSPQIGVDFTPTNIRGHSCGATCTSGYGQYLNPDELEILT